MSEPRGFQLLLGCGHYDDPLVVGAVDEVGIVTDEEGVA